MEPHQTVTRIRKKQVPLRGKRLDESQCQQDHRLLRNENQKGLRLIAKWGLSNLSMMYCAQHSLGTVQQHRQVAAKKLPVSQTRVKLELD